jgi:hypothetical protein
MSHSEPPQKSSKTPETKEKPKFKDLATLTEDAVLSIFDPDFKGVDDGQVEPYVPIPAPIGPRPNWREAVLDQLNPQFLKEEYGYGKGIIDSLPEPSEEFLNEYIKGELSDDLQEGYALGEHGRPVRPKPGPRWGRGFPKEMNRPITKAEEAALKAVMTEEDYIAFNKAEAAADKADLELERDLRQRNVSQKGKWARILKQSRDWEAAQKQKNPNFKGVDDGG